MLIIESNYDTFHFYNFTYNVLIEEDDIVVKLRACRQDTGFPFQISAALLDILVGDFRRFLLSRRMFGYIHTLEVGHDCLLPKYPITIDGYFPNTFMFIDGKAQLNGLRMPYAIFKTHKNQKVLKLRHDILIHKYEPVLSFVIFVRFYWSASQKCKNKNSGSSLWMNKKVRDILCRLSMREMLHVIVGAGRYRPVDGQMGAAACTGPAAEVPLDWPQRETCEKNIWSTEKSNLKVNNYHHHRRRRYYHHHHWLLSSTDK
jgi:hypothetical protein